MRSISRISLAFLLVTAIIAAPSILHAQQTSSINLSRLAEYYEQFVRESQRLRPNGENLEQIKKRIADERLVIRSMIERELLSLTQTDEDDFADPRYSLNRQRVILELLRDREREHSMNLEFLAKEEKLYKQGMHTATGAQMVDIILTTQSYPELLAKEAMLEERLDVLATLIATQRERVQQLDNTQRDRQIAIALSFLFFLVVVLSILWIERMVRTHVLVHIPNRTFRYASTKIFMTAVYGGLLFWIMQEMLLDYPNILTAVAFVGAAVIVALQDIIKGFVGWLTQVQLLTLGNRVTIGTPNGPVTGDVVDVGILSTSLLVVRTPELENISQVGKMIRVPNSYLLTHSVVNYNSTSDFIRVEIPVLLKDPNQGPRAKQVFETILKEKTDKYFEAAHRQIEKRTRRFFFPPEFHLSTVFMELRKSGVLCVLCFMVPMRKRRLLVTEITESVITYCQQLGIEMKFVKDKEE